MKSKLYMGLVTVKAKAPKYYRPSVMTFKFGVLLDSKGDKLLEKIKADYIGYVKSRLEIQNPTIGLEYKADITLTPVSGFSVDYYQISQSKVKDDGKHI